MSDKPREKQTRAERVESLDAVPKDDLRELIEEWRDTADEIAHPEESVNALNACANQLKRVLSGEDK